MSQAAAEERRRITYSEFCDLPLKDDRRYELIDGQIFADGQPVDLEEVLNRKPVFAMNQGSPRHARLAASLIIRLEMALGGRCHVLGPVGVYCEAMATAYAPDVVVVCEIPQLDPVRGRAIVNPRAIFEVLSSNTERIDKGTKLHHYRTLESLQEYVLVSQNERLVQIYRRGPDGWLWQNVSAGGFEVCGATISIEDIYAGIDAMPVVS